MTFMTQSFRARKELWGNKTWYDFERVRWSHLLVSFYPPPISDRIQRVRKFKYFKKSNKQQHDGGFQNKLVKFMAL